MTDDPFAALEEAVSAVEATAARLLRQRQALQAQLEGQTGRAENLQDSRREDLDQAARIHQLEDERAAVRERLERLRVRLSEISHTLPETPST